MTPDKFTYWGWAVTIDTDMSGARVVEAKKDGRERILLVRWSVEEARVGIKLEIENQENSYRKAKR